MEYYALPSQYDRLLDDLRYHLANVDEDGQVVVVSYIMPCGEIMAMVDEAKSRGVRTVVAVDAKHAKHGAFPVRCHGSEAMHAKYIVAGETVVVADQRCRKHDRGNTVYGADA